MPRRHPVPITMISQLWTIPEDRASHPGEQLPKPGWIECDCAPPPNYQAGMPEIKEPPDVADEQLLQGRDRTELPVPHPDA
eukprot:9481406-Pyramimonas_sp.AAC.1